MWELSAEASAERTWLRGHAPRGQLGPFAAEGHINQLRSSDRDRRISWGPSSTVRRASIAPSRSTSLLVAKNQRRNRLSRSLSMERLCSRSRQKQTSNFLRILRRSRHPTFFAFAQKQTSNFRADARRRSRHPTFAEPSRSRHPTFAEPSAGEPNRQPAFCAINPNQLIWAFDSRRH
jgi:hypothetical protein